MQSTQPFLQSDIRLLRQLVHQFFAQRETRKLLMNLSDDQKKDLGIQTSQTSNRLLMNPPW